MANHEGKRVPMTQPTPIIGQRFLEVDVPAEYRKLPEGMPLALAGLFKGDKDQLDRIEAKIDRIEANLNRLFAGYEAMNHLTPETLSQAMDDLKRAVGPKAT